MDILSEEEKTLIANAHIASVESVTGRQPLYEAVASIKQKAVEEERERIITVIKTLYENLPESEESWKAPDYHKHAINLVLDAVISALSNQQSQEETW